MSNYSIPVLDLNDYLSGSENQKLEFIRGVGSALRDVGFFALTNHNLSTDLISAGYNEVAKLFALSNEEKNIFEVKGLKGQRGYTSYGKEHAKDSKAPDLKEFWHVGQEFEPNHQLSKEYPENVWPDQLPSFKPVMLDVYQKLEKCALAILEACSIFLNEDSSLIRDMAKNGNSILRLIHYPPIPLDCNPESIRAAAHEDINLITLLIEATASGLEIQDRTGRWIPVTTPPGCIIVDSGDMLQNLTNGYFKSTTHRVVNPSNNRERRYSMPFFVHARAEVSLAPLSSCILHNGGTAKYPDITAGQYLNQRLAEIGLA